MSQTARPSQATQFINELQDNNDDEIESLLFEDKVDLSLEDEHKSPDKSPIRKRECKARSKTLDNINKTMLDHLNSREIPFLGLEN